MRLWLRRLFHLRPILDRASVSARQADWLRRSAVPTEADEEARLRDEEGQDPFKGRFFQAAGATTRAGGAAGPVLVSVATGQRTSQTKKPTPKRGQDLQRPDGAAPY